MKNHDVTQHPLSPAPLPARGARGSFALKPQHPFGFTLIEILLVIVLLSITLGFALVNWQDDDRQTLQRSAERLALLLSQAQSEAIFRGYSIAWQITPSGYRFLQRGNDPAWVSLDDGDVLQAQDWQDGIEVDALDIPGQTSNAERLLVFKAIGLSSPFTLSMRLNAQQLTLSGDGRQVRVAP